MSTTAPTRVTDLSRHYLVEVNTAADPGTNYEALDGREDTKLIIEPRTFADESNEDGGAMREESSGYSWRLEVVYKNSLNALGTSRDAVHAFIRSKFLDHTLRGKAVAQSEFGIRFYHEKGIAGEAHEGRVYVKSYTVSGPIADPDKLTVVLQGQGPLTEITNPAASQVPVVTTVTPNSGAAAGSDQLVEIFGDHFTGASAVDFGANPAEDFKVQSDSHITALPPAGVGTVQVKVTTAAGASADVAADDYTYV